MTNIGITEGMGKKIVEALKKQSELEQDAVQPENVSFTQTNEESEPEIEFVEPEVDNYEVDNSVQTENSNDINFKPQETYIPNAASFAQPQIQTDSHQQNINQPFTPVMNFASSSNVDSSDLDFDMPTNVAVLKQLIMQLPTGVTKQTGAQIIKQTMEALGISMKSVLQEAQQVQESLNNSSRECQANIIEYKRQIALLEKQSQTYQKQYAVLNDIISLFIQTNNY